MLRPLILLSCLLPVPVLAGVYKCVDSAGNTSYSEASCPAGSSSKRIELAEPAAPASRPTLISAAGQPAAPQLPPASADNADERLRLAQDWLATSYPFLDIQSAQADLAAIQLLLNLQNQAMATGADQADALVSAARLVGSQYRTASAPAAPASSPPAAPATSSSEPAGLTVISLEKEKDKPADSQDRSSEPLIQIRPVVPAYYDPYRRDPHYRDYPPHWHPPRPPEEPPRRSSGRALHD